MNWLTPLIRIGGEFPHPAVTIFAAVVVAAVAGLLGQGSGRARLNYAAYLAICCVGAVIAGSWVMRLIHG
jgi:hypothetical protein